MEKKIVWGSVAAVVLIGLVVEFGFWPILAVIVGVAVYQLRNINKED